MIPDSLFPRRPPSTVHRPAYACDTQRNEEILSLKALLLLAGMSVLLPDRRKEPAEALQFWLLQEGVGSFVSNGDMTKASGPESTYSK